MVEGRVPRLQLVGQSPRGAIYSFTPQSYYIPAGWALYGGLNESSNSDQWYTPETVQSNYSF